MQKTNSSTHCPTLSLKCSFRVHYPNTVMSTLFILLIISVCLLVTQLFFTQIALLCIYKDVSFGGEYVANCYVTTMKKRLDLVFIYLI